MGFTMLNRNGSFTWGMLLLTRAWARGRSYTTSYKNIILHNFQFTSPCLAVNALPKKIWPFLLHNGFEYS